MPSSYFLFRATRLGRNALRDLYWLVRKRDLYARAHSSKFEPAASPLSELTSNVVSIYMSLSCRTFSMP